MERNFEMYENISADINKFFGDTVVNKTAKLLTQIEVIFEPEKRLFWRDTVCGDEILE